MKKIPLFILFVICLITNVFSQDVISIAEVQGEEFLSPLDGKDVTVQGIVTAIGNRGFYIQTPTDKIDDNPNTSEGIFIFTKDAPPPDVIVGSLLEVSGKAAEYRPERDLYSLFLTQITDPKIKVISKDNPLPIPYSLTAQDLKPDGNPNQLERFEGMRIRIDELEVVAPTGGFTDRNTGLIRSSGEFYGVLVNTPRPFREPGLETLKVLFDKLPQTLPVFDMNPELIKVDSDGLRDGQPIDVTNGAKVKNLLGVLDYNFRDYTLLLDPKIKAEVANNQTYIKASPAGEREITVANFNLENFFDDEQNSALSEPETKVSKDTFKRRLKKASLAIREVVSAPDVLGVNEVENLAVLKKLAEQINRDAEKAKQPNPKYEAFLEEGNDGRGIDVGFLIKTSKVKVKKVQQLAKDIKLDHKDAGEGETLFSRPPLLIEVEIPTENDEKPFAFTAIVNHFKSYGGIDDPKSGDRVQNKKRQQAEFLAKYIQERQKENPDEMIIVMGDFNSFQFSDGFNDLIGILKGKPEINVLTPSKETYDTGLINLVDFISEKNRYSYIYRGSAQVLDHILINRPTRGKAKKFGYARLNADFPEIYANDENRPERVSDHDVPVVYLSMGESVKN